MRLALLLLLCVAACDREDPGSRILAITGGDAVAGKAAIGKFGCGSCHVIPGVARARGPGAEHAAQPGGVDPAA
jgi:cytochrome c